MKEIRVGGICGMIMIEESQLLRGKIRPSDNIYHKCHVEFRERLATKQLSYAMGYWDIYINISGIYALCHGNNLYEHRRAQGQLTETSGIFRFKPDITIQHMYNTYESAPRVDCNSSHTKSYCEIFCKFSGKEIHKALQNTYNCY
jgi:hypothetical protein